jgi:hypothetical protein
MRHALAVLVVTVLLAVSGALFALIVGIAAWRHYVWTRRLRKRGRS